MTEPASGVWYPLATRPLQAKEIPWLVADFTGIPEPADNAVRVQLRLDLLQALVCQAQTDMDRPEMVWLRVGLSGLRHSLDVGTWAIRAVGSGRETDDSSPHRILYRSGWVFVAGSEKWLAAVTKALVVAAAAILPHNEVRRRVARGRELSRPFVKHEPNPG